MVLMALMVLAALASTANAASELRLISIGTGAKTGVYYAVGGGICELVNRNRMDHGIRCLATSTDGSTANLRDLRAGRLTLGLVQSDLHHHAFNGTGPFENAGPNRNLRSVFSLHPEPFTVVARRDADINRIEDLRGKRVNIGNPGSGQRGTMEILMEALGWEIGDFDLASELPSGEQGQALCEDRVDAIVFAVGHPNKSVADAISDCDAVLMPVTGEVIDRLVEIHPFYRRAVIPGGMYPHNPEDVESFGTGATLVTNIGVDSLVIHRVVKAVFDNFEEFKSLHPALAALDRERMITDGLSAPFHFGAIRYFQDAGIEWRRPADALPE
jgi:TRAP transporter TAXI family solute receptor